ncbi:MAG: polymer-forming cytoskeletal protein [Acidobacteriia bacterium]|nr:polymer-forming cytoskeletal protein [Terriglobia bacterium]
MNWKKDKGPDVVTGFLDQGVFFEGHLAFSGTLRVDGSIKGTIKTDDHLLVGEHGVLEAEIHAGTVSIGGRVTGVIHAKERVQIHSKGRVSGEIHTPVLIIETGAIFDGKSFMTEPGDSHSEIEQPERVAAPVG